MKKGVLDPETPLGYGLQGGWKSDPKFRCPTSHAVRGVLLGCFGLSECLKALVGAHFAGTPSWVDKATPGVLLEAPSVRGPLAYKQPAEPQLQITVRKSRLDTLRFGKEPPKLQVCEADFLPPLVLTRHGAKHQ